MFAYEISEKTIATNSFEFLRRKKLFQWSENSNTRCPIFVMLEFRKFQQNMLTTTK